MYHYHLMHSQFLVAVGWYNLIIFRWSLSKVSDNLCILVLLGYGIMRKLRCLTALRIMTTLIKEFRSSVLLMNLMRACFLLLQVNLILWLVFFRSFILNFFVFNLPGECHHRWRKYPDLEGLFLERSTETSYCILLNSRSQAWCPECECCGGLAATVWISGTPFPCCMTSF